MIAMMLLSNIHLWAALLLFGGFALLASSRKSGRSGVDRRLMWAALGAGPAAGLAFFGAWTATAEPYVFLYPADYWESLAAVLAVGMTAGVLGAGMVWAAGHLTLGKQQP